MINMNIVNAEQLPKESGIVFFINNAGEVTTLTASTNVAQRCEPKKMKRAQTEAVNKNYDKFTSQDPIKTARLMSYPESYDRLVFWPMPYALADAEAKRIRKIMKSRLTRFFG
tara:strand:- start:1165 stop:1503 length:339 start_codon:yes stop_codon:yes gene_type:complete